MAKDQIRIGDLVVVLLAVVLVIIGVTATGFGWTFAGLVVITAAVIIAPTPDRNEVPRRIAGWILVAACAAVALGSGAAITVLVIGILVAMAAVSALLPQMRALAIPISGARTWAQQKGTPVFEPFWLAVRAPIPVFDTTTATRQVGELQTDDWFLAVDRIPLGLVVETADGSTALLRDLSVVIRSQAADSTP